MSQEDKEKIYNYIESDDTENFYTLLSDIISENKNNNELNQKLDNIFDVIVNQININNYIQRFSFLCLFCEILIYEK